MIAPFEYIALIMAIIWGITIFGEWPDAVAWLGIAVDLWFRPLGFLARVGVEEKGSQHAKAYAPLNARGVLSGRFLTKKNGGGLLHRRSFSMDCCSIRQTTNVRKHDHHRDPSSRQHPRHAVPCSTGR